MKILESAVLLTAIAGGVSWTVISTKDGFKQNNAMIVARSIDISSTIDGEVENDQLAVGTPLKARDVMVKIRNTRVDHSRVTELKTKVNYLNLEIKNGEDEQHKLKQILQTLKEKSRSYKTWLVEDLKLQNDVKVREHLVAKKQELLKTQNVKHKQVLFKKHVISSVELQTAKTEANIASNLLKVKKTELLRIQRALKSVKKNDIFFENGDASYWQKMIDSVTLKVLDSHRKISELRAQLTQFSEQVKVEKVRLKKDFVEEHRAPFSGIVNAVYVAKGAHVKSGTLLMQVLDCSNPVVIVPIPESRFSDFSIGKKVTINPIDSERSFSGTIKYISSGPLISQDKTIALQQELTVRGNHAVISFDNRELENNMANSCDTTRRAVVTIKTHSLYEKINTWAQRFWSTTDTKIALNNAEKHTQIAKHEL